MPRASLALEHLPERAMRLPALRRARRVVDGAADDRMREPRPPVAEADEPALLGLRETLAVHPGLPARGADRGQVVAGVGRRHEQRVARGPVELVDPPGERVAQPVPRRQRQLDSRGAVALVARERGRQLDQPERVAGRRFDDRGGGRRGEIRGDAAEHLQRGGGVERGELQLGEPRALQRLPGIAGSQHDRDRPAGPARRVEHALARGGVEPVDVVDDREDGTARRGGAQQAERRHAHGEAVAGRRRPQRERGCQRAGLRRRQRPAVLDHGREEVRQRGERELGLGLDPARPEQRDAVVAPGGEGVQQRRLADPRLSVHDERAAVPGTQSLEEPVEPAELRRPAHDHLPNLREQRGARQTTETQGPGRS